MRCELKKRRLRGGMENERGENVLKIREMKDQRSWRGEE